MATVTELLDKYAHSPEDFPILMEQTHKILRDRKIINERINVNENIIHYVTDTARLISEIDGRLGGGKAYDHIIYLDKSARPVSFLVNLFWNDFAAKNSQGCPVKRPEHSYVNIDRSPWFRNVGIKVSDDGRQKENGELATYADFVKNIDNLSKRHLAEIRALYVTGNFVEDENWIMNQPSILDGKRILIVDEVSRTGSTLEIAKHLYRLAIPNAESVEGTYYWHPTEPPLKMGDETMLTSLPVWYDPNTLLGRGIGSPSQTYYSEVRDRCLKEYEGNPSLEISKLKRHAFSSEVFSAPLLKDDGSVLDLAEEKKTRSLCRDLIKLHEEYVAGRLFFVPPIEWSNFDEYDTLLEKQGVMLLPWDASDEEIEKIRCSSLFYLNFVKKLRGM